MGLFDFFSMANNYEERKVANYSKDGITVDTCAIYDSKQPYETALEHPSYNDGEFIVVEMYDSKEDATKGHKRWVKTMTSSGLPKMLKDVSSAEICKFIDSQEWRNIPKKKKHA